MKKKNKISTITIISRIIRIMDGRSRYGKPFKKITKVLYYLFLLAGAVSITNSIIQMWN